MTPADSAAMKKLYYEAAKMLHPDVNPNLSEEQKQLWNVIAEAYLNGDILTIRNVAAAIKSISVIPEEITEYHSLTKQVELFKERNRNLLNRIKVVQEEFPFTFAKKLEDDEWLASEYRRIDHKIRDLIEQKKKYLDYITLMTESRHE